MLDQTNKVWVYRPRQHKTLHHGRSREVFLGNQCQTILAEYLEGRDPETPCFSPAEAVASVRLERRANRKTPPSCGNKEGTNRRQKPKRVPRASYDTIAYCKAVARACERAFPPPKYLARLKGETNADWKSRLGQEGLAELAEWRKAHSFHPNQLRHSFATDVRRDFGLEASQILLGHAKADVTQVYAERDTAKAIAVAAQIG
jgi:integrase